MAEETAELPKTIEQQRQGSTKEVPSVDQADAEQLPDFLPKGCSHEQFRDAVLNNLDAILELIPPLPTQGISMSQLETVEVGTYVLPGRPSTDLMKELSNFKGGEAEVGLFCINGRWLISLSEGMETGLPYPLSAIESRGVFQADIHSHPGDDQEAEFPSIIDIHALKSTIDGKNYIATQKGLLEFQKPEKLPGGYTSVYDVTKAWTHWIREELKLSKEGFNHKGGSKLMKEFCTKFFGLRTIPWESEGEISDLLAHKETLQVAKPLAIKDEAPK